MTYNDDLLLRYLQVEKGIQKILLFFFGDDDYIKCCLYGTGFHLREHTGVHESFLQWGISRVSMRGVLHNILHRKSSLTPVFGKKMLQKEGGAKGSRYSDICDFLFRYPIFDDFKTNNII